VKESTYDKYTFLIEGFGSLSGFPMEELKHELFVWTVPLIGPSPRGAGTRSSGRVFERLSARITGQNWDGRIRLSLSNPGIGEMKLSKSCFQEIKICDHREAMKTKISQVPYRVPFYCDVVRPHLLVGGP
jgi:hypothetical protein